MTEKDKEIQELRRENEKLTEQNIKLVKEVLALQSALHRVIDELNCLLQAVSTHTKNIRDYLKG